MLIHGVVVRNADGVLEVDPVPVDRQGHVRDPRRLEWRGQYGTDRHGPGTLGLQVGVTLNDRNGVREGAGKGRRSKHRVIISIAGAAGHHVLAAVALPDHQVLAQRLNVVAVRVARDVAPARGH